MKIISFIVGAGLTICGLMSICDHIESKQPSDMIISLLFFIWAHLMYNSDKK